MSPQLRAVLEQGRAMGATMAVGENDRGRPFMAVRTNVPGRLEEFVLFIADHPVGQPHVPRLLLPAEPAVREWRLANIPN